MIPIQGPLVGISRWAPAPYSPARKDIGQQAPAPAPVPAVVGEVTVSPSATILDSPLLALATDVTAAGASAYLAYNLGKLGSGWATLWWIVATAAGIKGLHDLARLNA